MSSWYGMLLLLILTFLPVSSEGQVLKGPEARIVSRDIYVGFSLALDAEDVEEVRNGIEKEFRFFVDLFRTWKAWPDEFVIGKTITRKIKADPIKKENVSVSNDGNIILEKRFKTVDSMLSWSLTFADLKLTNVRELDPGEYFVRITVESKIRKLPPVVGYLLIFLSENEFRIVRDSSHFLIEGAP